MAFFVALVLISLTPAGASGDNLCAKARYSEVNSVVRGSGNPSFERDCFETYLPSAGLLMLEVTVPDAAQIEPRLDFLGRRCDGWEGHRESFEYQARLANSVLVEVRGAGNYLFCVTAQDPAEKLDDFKLVNGFATLGLEKGDPDESEPEPDPLVGTAGFDKGDPDESEPEPDPLVGTAGLEKGDPDESEPEPDPLVAGPLAELRRICGQTRADDHGDTLRCATPIALGREVRAEVGNDWGDDADLFAFTVGELTSVLIETTGVTDTAGGLYDANGYLLRTAGGGGSGENFRIVKTLSPGRYFVRVAGGVGAEGPYGLTVGELVADD
jgi:hypothetical protein